MVRAAPHSLDTSLSMLFSRDPNTIFRGNSLTSKCIDETMKLAGMQYLHVTLKPTIEEVRARRRGGWVPPEPRAVAATPASQPPEGASKHPRVSLIFQIKKILQKVHCSAHTGGPREEPPSPVLEAVPPGPLSGRGISSAQFNKKRVLCIERTEARFLFAL